MLVGQHPVEWVAAVQDLLDNPSARRWLIENGRRRLAADYSRETVRQQLLDVIRSVQPARSIPVPAVADGAVRPA
jgi:glycosyltransferase involved in cell wall biosynthesis